MHPPPTFHSYNVCNISYDGWGRHLMFSELMVFVYKKTPNVGQTFGARLGVQGGGENDSGSPIKGGC